MLLIAINLTYTKPFKNMTTNPHNFLLTRKLKNFSAAGGSRASFVTLLAAIVGRKKHNIVLVSHFATASAGGSRGLLGDPKNKKYRKNVTNEARVKTARHFSKSDDGKQEKPTALPNPNERGFRADSFVKPSDNKTGPRNFIKTDGGRFYKEDGAKVANATGPVKRASYGANATSSYKLQARGKPGGLGEASSAKTGEYDLVSNKSAGPAARGVNRDLRLGSVKGAFLNKGEELPLKEGPLSGARSGGKGGFYGPLAALSDLSSNLTAPTAAEPRQYISKYRTILSAKDAKPRNDKYPDNS